MKKMKCYKRDSKMNEKNERKCQFFQRVFSYTILLFVVETNYQFEVQCFVPSSSQMRRISVVFFFIVIIAVIAKDMR